MRLCRENMRKDGSICRLSFSFVLAPPKSECEFLRVKGALILRDANSTDCNPTETGESMAVYPEV